MCNLEELSTQPPVTQRAKDADGAGGRGTAPRGAHCVCPGLPSRTNSLHAPGTHVFTPGAGPSSGNKNPIEIRRSLWEGDRVS